ncbi:MAG: hypothetical protein VX202_04280 [Pseudomonadota bacterium]|uniref:hypothetical protein n=1 Tax=Rhodovulum sp. FJ3 TaxID=3079053 RepID=UPI00293DF889|nr:hypothetical protein [Rhodovulum sp. FJ3]MDV4168633.1 hypothetical protein [Rhodovulum sp. FJ3]MEE3316957.1 hypothetical protein [Pseudomonadota bacterium]
MLDQLTLGRCNMADEWILEVLDDLRAFALANGLSHLAQELGRTKEIARQDLGGVEPAQRPTDDVVTSLDSHRRKTL